jgi:hypothetical protein
MTTVMAACMATLAAARVEEPAATRKRRRATIYESDESEESEEEEVCAPGPNCPSDLPWVASDYELRPRPGERIFDDDEEGEVWRAVPWHKPAQDLIVSNFGYYRVRRKRRRGCYGKKTRGYLGEDGRYFCGDTQVSTLVCEAFRGRKPTPTHSVDHFHSDQIGNNHIDNLWWRTKSEQRGNQKRRIAQRTGQPVDVRKNGTQEWVSYASKTSAIKATGVCERTTDRILNDKGNAGCIYEFRVGDPPESQQPILPPIAEDPEEERWAFARMRNGEESKRVRVSTRGRAQTKTSNGEAWSLIYTPKPNDGTLYAKLKVDDKTDKMHAVVWRTFRPDEPIDYANGGSIDHKDRDKTNNALYNLKTATPSEQNLNKDRKDRTQIQDSQKQDVFGYPDGVPVDTPREWIGQSTAEAAEALSERFEIPVDSGGISRSILKGYQHCGWRFFATPDLATDAKVAAEHARVLAALDDLDARVAAAV